MIFLKKRVFCSLLAVLVLSLFMPHITWAAVVASGECGPDGNETSVAWSLDDKGTLTISGTGNMKEFDTKDDVPWKNNKENIKAIKITKDVTSIGKYAFAECPITSIILHNKVISVGENSFTSCSDLTTLFYEKDLDIRKADIPTTTTTIAYEVTKEEGTDKEVNLVNASANVTIPCNAMGNGYKIVGNKKGEKITLTHKVTTWTNVAEETNKQIGTCDICGTSVERTTPSPAEVAKGNCGPDENESSVTWSLDDAGTLTISGTGNMKNYDASRVPWYDKKKEIKSIIINDGVNSIGDYAFESCTNLTSITIPEGVTSIGNYAFGLCTSLTSVTLPNSVTSIGDLAFVTCLRLKSINIPNKVTSIGNYTFTDCTSLTSITIPEGVTSIGKDAFMNCSGLTSVILPNSVTSIGDRAFYNCTALKTLFCEATLDLNKAMVSSSTSIIRYTVEDDSSTPKEVTITAIENTDSASFPCNAMGDNYKITISEQIKDKVTLEHQIDTYTLDDADTTKHKGTCKRCGIQAEQKHTYGDYTPKDSATCSKVGTEAATCTVCGHTDVRQSSSGTAPHEWDDGVITTPATCIDAGIKTYTCKNCGGKMDTSIPPFEPDDPTAGVHYWGKKEIHSGYTMYVDKDGKTSTMINGNGKIYLREESYDPQLGRHLASWYILDNTSGEFEAGSRFWVKWINNKDNPSEFSKYFQKIDQSIKDRVDSDRIWIFLIGVTKSDGTTEYKVFTKDIPIYVQLGTDWDYNTIKAVFISDGDDENVYVSHLNMDYPEGNCDFVELNLKHFSPYAIYESKTAEEKESSSNSPKTAEEKESSSNSPKTAEEKESSAKYPKTGDNSGQAILKLSLSSMLILAGLFLAIRMKKKAN